MKALFAKINSLKKYVGILIISCIICIIAAALLFMSVKPTGEASSSADSAAAFSAYNQESENIFDAVKNNLTGEDSAFAPFPSLDIPITVSEATPAPTIPKTAKPKVTKAPTPIPVPTPVPLSPKAQLEVLCGLSENSLETEFGLINLRDLKQNWAIDMRYAGDNNFMHKVLYAAPVCALRPETALMLVKANKKLNTFGYKLLIWDAFRPYEVQQEMKSVINNTLFIAESSKHNIGAAVDVSIVALDGSTVEMPSDFDDFTGAGSRNSCMSSNAQNNLKILTNAMTSAGFATYSSEWWHFTNLKSTSFPVLARIDVTIMFVSKPEITPTPIVTSTPSPDFEPTPTPVPAE